MPDCSDSTRLATTAQRALVEIVSELQQLEKRLETLAQAIAPDPAAVLPAELRAGVECARSELLRDAITTLSALAVLTEDAFERRVEVAAAVERIAVFG